jgi:hypothetical protein
MIRFILALSSILIAFAIAPPAKAGDRPSSRSTPEKNVYIVPKHLSTVEKFEPKTTMLNRIELRNCMTLEASNKARLAELDVKAAKSDKERLALVAAAGADKQAEEAWMTRYDALLKEDDDLNASREEYFMDCARRPHKQEDEDAIKAEK